MTSFAELMVLAGFAVAGAGVPAALPAVPAEWNAMVAVEVAAVWQVPAERITLQWGRARVAWPASGTPFELTGRGVDGWFVAVFDPRGDRAQAMQVRAGMTDTVWVATRPLATGEHLADSDVRADVRVRWGAKMRTPDRPVAGAEVRRPLAAGSEIAWPAVVAPALVVAGAPVRLAWSNGAVTVSLNGIALNSARRGEAVRARVDGRTTRLTGTAIAPAVVALGSGGER